MFINMGYYRGVQNVLSALDGKAEMVVDCVCVCVCVCLYMCVDTLSTCLESLGSSAFFSMK